MKKAYFTPETFVVKMRTEPVLGITSTSDSQANQNASNFSRNNSSWDDEDDDY